MSFFAQIDYQCGNLSSVSKALEAAGTVVRIASRPEDAAGAVGLVLPGVGNFGDAMAHLESTGWCAPIRAWIRADKPFLGICLGLQMLFDCSEEAPGVPGLGVFRGTVRRFPTGSEKVPHMGWNTVTPVKDAPFFESVQDGTYFYFVHSYYVVPEDAKIAAAHTDYIHPFVSAVSRGNLLATQFHPEKSQGAGQALLKAFVNKNQEQ